MGKGENKKEEAERGKGGSVKGKRRQVNRGQVKRRKMKTGR